MGVPVEVAVKVDVKKTVLVGVLVGMMTGVLVGVLDGVSLKIPVGVLLGPRVFVRDWANPMDVNKSKKERIHRGYLGKRFRVKVKKDAKNLLQFHLRK